MTEPSSNLASDLTIAGLLVLPESERQLLIWMQRQGRCSFAQIKDFLQQPDALILSLLQDLQHQGFIQIVTSQGESSYRVKLTSMRQIRFQKQTGNHRLENLLDDL